MPPNTKNAVGKFYTEVKFQQSALDNIKLIIREKHNSLFEIHQIQ